jgi:hypothetical protein
MAGGGHSVDLGPGWLAMAFFVNACCDSPGSRCRFDPTKVTLSTKDVAQSEFGHFDFFGRDRFWRFVRHLSLG